MRISADEKDPGYGQFLVCRESGRWPKVLVDGAEITHVVTADSDKGFVVRNVTDKNGKLSVDATGEAIQTETLRGKIEFKFPQRIASSRNL